MENYNRKIRSIIENWVEEGASYGLDAKQSIGYMVPNIYLWLNSSKKDLSVAAMLLLNITYLDAYKIYTYQHRSMLGTDVAEDYLYNVYFITSYDDLINKISNDPLFLAKALESSYQFANLSGLGKIIVMKSLSMRDNEWLVDNYPIHKFDLEAYDKEVDIDMLIKYIRAKTNYQQKVLSIDFEEAIITELVGFLQQLFIVDSDNAMNLLLEIGKIDYAASRYMINKQKDETGCFADHVDYYENYNLDDILYRLLHDKCFLQDAIWMLGAVGVHHEFEGVPLSMDAISDENTDQINKKLILN